MVFRWFLAGISSYKPSKNHPKTIPKPSLEKPSHAAVQRVSELFITAS
jgi:hypothetical protein